MIEVHQTSRFIWLATHCCCPETRFNGLYIWGNLILKNANWEALNKDSHVLALPSPQWGTSWWHRSPWPAWRRGRTWSVWRWTVWSWDSIRSTGSRQPIHSSRPAAEKHHKSERDTCKCLIITLHKPLQWFTIKQWILKHICTFKSIIKGSVTVNQWQRQNNLFKIKNQCTEEKHWEGLWTSYWPVSPLAAQMPHSYWL